MQIDEKLKDMHIVCRDNGSNEKWLINGKVTPIDRKPVDWKKCNEPMYSVKEK